MVKLQQEVDEAAAAADKAREEGKEEEAKQLGEKAEVIRTVGGWVGGSMPSFLPSSIDGLIHQSTADIAIAINK